MPGFTATASNIFMNFFTDCFNLSLLAISATKFQASYLKRHKAISQFDDVN